MPTNVTDLDRELANDTKTASTPPAAQAPPKRSLWSNPRFRFGVLGSALILLVVVVAYAWYASGRVSTDDAEVDGHLNPVSAKISGSIIEVDVDDNQPVKAGQVLVRIDPRDYQARVDQLRAALGVAQAQASAANVNVPLTAQFTQGGATSASADLQSSIAEQASAEQALQIASTSDLSYAQAEVNKRQATADRAQADLTRMKPLADKAEISQLQYDGYVAAAREAQGDLDAAKQQLEQARQNVTVAKDKLQSANAHVTQAQAGQEQARANLKQTNVSQANAAAAGASIDQAKANLAAAELDLSYTTIVAPVDGVVTRKSVEVGEVVQSGQGLLVVVPLQDVWVTANFKETQLRNVHPGQQAEVHVDMYGKSFTGHVDSIAGATGARLSLLPPENATGNFVKVVERIPVKIVLDPIPPDKAILRPGMNVDATIVTR